MKRYIIMRAEATLMILFLVGALCACGGKKNQFSNADFESNHKNIAKITYAFSKSDASKEVTYDKAVLQKFKEDIMSQTVEYPYPELFDYEEAINGIKSGFTVKEHACSALDLNGKLTVDYLVEIVKENSNTYVEEKETKVFKTVNEDLLRGICKVLVETTQNVLEQYPDIDKERVYCNLGNLKIVEKSSALDFAAIEPGMVLHVNRNTASMVDIFTSSNMYNVLVHETMHIIQYGCECENVEGCIRRCGLAYAYSDREQDYSDWMWLVEGSAERMACLHDKVEPMTYQNLVNYILSLDLAILLKEEMPANYVETICFYNDLDKLFDSFDAKTKEEKQEIYHMIYALEIIQMIPTDVKEAYAKIYSKEYTAEEADVFNNKVKRSVVKTLTKRFYNNLATALMEQSVTQNDVLFLLNLFESTINYHILFESQNHKAYNAEFERWYCVVQSNFFDCITNISLEDYKAYQSYDDTKTICASMKWLEQAKCDFLIEKFEDHLCDYKFIEGKIE